MSKYKIAHIREQGVDLIIIPLDSSFGHKSGQTQTEIIHSLQACANAAGLAGKVVPVWQEGSHYSFIAPTQWHAYFKSISWDDVVLNINKELTCG